MWYDRGMDRWILHVDMDEFFAAVEKLDCPSLAGKPLLIGGDARRRGVVSTASYEARKFGCHSAMPMATAVGLCPQAIVLPVRGKRYREISERVLEVFQQFTPLVEPLSIDEAFLDLTGCERLWGSAVEAGRLVKHRIREEVGLSCSVGVAPNKYLAKLASELDKPDGLTVIPPDRIHEMLDPLPVRRVWGVGPAAARKLQRLNVQTIGQLRRTDPDLLAGPFGSSAEHLLALAEGRDRRPVTPDHRAKSIGTETTFARDIDDVDVLVGTLLGQVEDVGRRLRRQGLGTRTVTLKIRHGDFTTRTRSASFEQATNSTEAIWKQARTIFTTWSERAFCPLRLLGVTACNLSRPGGQLSLWDAPATQRDSRLDQAMDTIAERFGESAIRRGGTLRPGGEG
jgi:DNA polymerase IV